MARFFTLALALFSGWAAAAEAGFPTVSYKSGVLVAAAAPDHKAQNPSVEVLETEECSASTASRTSLRVSGRCAFLKAMFSYQHQEPKTGRQLKTLVGFTFSSQGTGHSLMVSGPFVTSRQN
jgi:hypothetical protein